MTESATVPSYKRAMIMIIVALLLVTVFLMFRLAEESQENNLSLPVQQSSVPSDGQGDAVKQDVPKQNMNGATHGAEKVIEDHAVKKDQIQIGQSEFDSIGIDQTEDSKLESLQAPLATRKSPVEGGGVIIELDDRYLHK